MRNAIRNACHAERSSEFVQRFSDLVRIRGDSVTFVAEIAHEPDLQPAPPAPPEREPPPRVRPDVWAALMDYRTGKRYAWDVARGEARPAQPEDALILPTIAAADLAAWRDDFAAKQPNPSMPDDWRSKALGTRLLPAELQGPWNGFVRERVIARAAEWFHQAGLQPPQLLVAGRTHDREGDPAAREIREVLIACIRAMTLDELREIKVPAAVVARAFRR